MFDKFVGLVGTADIPVLGIVEKPGVRTYGICEPSICNGLNGVYIVGHCGRNGRSGSFSVSLKGRGWQRGVADKVSVVANQCRDLKGKWGIKRVFGNVSLGFVGKVVLDEED